MDILELQQKLFIKSLENYESDGCYSQDLIIPIEVALIMKPIFEIRTNTKVFYGNVFSNKNGIFQVITIESKNSNNIDYYYNELVYFVKQVLNNKKTIRTSASGRIDIKAELIHISDSFNTKYGLKKHVLLRSDKDFYFGIISNKHFDYFDKGFKILNLRITSNNIKENLNDFKSLKIL